MPMATPRRSAGLERLSTSRRAFLRQSGLAALGLTIASQLGWQIGCAGPSTRHSPGSPSPAAWKDLEERLKRGGGGLLLLPGNPRFAETGLATNLAYRNIRPQGIVLPANALDVQTSVKWARENGLPAVPRSGGHSYAGYSSTLGLLIDLSPLGSIDVDVKEGYAHLGAGALLGAIDQVAGGLDMVVPGGRCIPVGIGGLVLGGGFGFNSRPFKLTCDNLSSTKIVTADGELRLCDDNNNKDLYWACRGGGGGNFGINVDFQIRAYPVKTAAVYKLTWSLADSQNAIKAWTLVQQVAMQAPDQFSLILVGVVGEGVAPSMEAIGQYLGPLKDLEDMLKPIVQATRPTTSILRQLGIAEANSFLAQRGAPDAYLTKSAFMNTGLPEVAIEKMLLWLGRFPKNSRSADFAIFRWGGEINKVPAEDTAFVHRQAAFVVEMDSSWPPNASPAVVEASKQWIQEFYRDMAPYFTGAAYQNFIDPTQTDWLAAYYGKNLSRLQAIKEKYDPDNFFNFAQSIPLP